MRAIFQNLQLTSCDNTVRPFFVKENLHEAHDCAGAGTDPDGDRWSGHAACRRFQLEYFPSIGEERFSTFRLEIEGESIIVRIIIIFFIKKIPFLPCKKTTCFPELGYKCSQSYFMPCTRNHDSRGVPIPGEEDGCPENFSCVSREFKDGSAKVCVPNEPDEYSYHQECEASFECGYSQLEVGWSRCKEGRCVRVLA